MHFIAPFMIILSRLTEWARGVVSSTSALQINKPVVLSKGALPTARKKGIITLTLVISRPSERPTVMRGSFMFNFLRVKTKLEMQIEEYLDWKSQCSVYAADNHKEILWKYLRPIKKEAVCLILEDLKMIHETISTTATVYSTTKAMDALRGFIGYYRSKKQCDINPKCITDTGVYELRKLRIVEESAIIPSMVKKKIGRPLHIELIKKVKSLKDNEGLSYRQIAKALNKDVSQVYVWHKFDIPKELLSK